MTTPKEIREWGVKNGLAKPGRGRLSAEVRAAYAKAHDVGSDSPKHDDGPPYSYDVPLPIEVDEGSEAETGGIAGLPPLPTERVRDENLSYTIDTVTGAMVGHNRCGTCGNSISCCAFAPGPSGVGWLEHSSPEEIYLVREEA